MKLLPAGLMAGTMAGLMVTGIVGQALAQTAPPAPASAAAQTPAAAQAPAPDSSGPQKYVVPAGTKVLLSLKSAINTKTARPGDGVYLESTFPVVVDGHVLIPNGVYVQGVVDRVVRPGRVKGRAQIGMHFTSLIFPNGQVVQIPGSVNSLPGSAGPKVKGSEGTIEQQGQAGRDTGTVLKGAGYGAGAGAIGGIAGGNPGAGLAYGGAAGAAAGAIYTLFTRGDDINIPTGSPIEMVLQRPMSLAAQSYATVGGGPGGDVQQQLQQYVPVDQQQPLSKPQQPPCPTGVTNCH
jgi:hypothetical protein